MVPLRSAEESSIFSSEGPSRSTQPLASEVEENYTIGPAEKSSISK